MQHQSSKWCLSFNGIKTTPFIFEKSQAKRCCIGCWYVTDTLRYVIEVLLVHLVSVLVWVTGERQKIAAFFENVIHRVSEQAQNSVCWLRSQNSETHRDVTSRQTQNPFQLTCLHNFTAKSGGYFINKLPNHRKINTLLCNSCVQMGWDFSASCLLSWSCFLQS